MPSLPDHGPPFIQLNVRMYVTIAADPPKPERMFDRLAELLDFVQADQAQADQAQADPSTEAEPYTAPPSPAREPKPKESEEQPVAA